MKISCCWSYPIFRYGYPPSIKDTFKALGDMSNIGFKFVEIETFNVTVNNIKVLWREKEKLKKVIDDLGLIVVNYPIIMPGLLSLNETIRKENLELFDIGSETAAYFKAETVQFDSFFSPIEFINSSPYKESMDFNKNYRININPDFSWKRAWDNLVNTYGICCNRLKKLGIKMTVEPRVGEMVPNTDSILRLIDYINDPNLGAVLDTAHLHAQKEIIPLSVEKLGDRIFYVHTADNDSCTNDHNKVGDGTIDWENTLLALKKHNYSGYFAIDVKPRNIEDIDKEYIESREYLEKIAQKIKM